MHQKYHQHAHCMKSNYLSRTLMIIANTLHQNHVGTVQTTFQTGVGRIKYVAQRKNYNDSEEQNHVTLFQIQANFM